MRQYDFTLRFAFGQPDADPEVFVERLMAEGCDDALIGLGQHGRIALNFTREATSAAEAILSALDDVQRAIPDAKLVEACPDLVGLTDIANMLGFSRQNMRKLMVSNRSDFPLPVYEGKLAIWHLSTVLSWFKERRTHEFDETLLEVAQTNRQCNLTREMAHLDPSISSRLRHLVAN
jgi:hypothetical protein